MWSKNADPMKLISHQKIPVLRFTHLIKCLPCIIFDGTMTKKNYPSHDLYYDTIYSISSYCLSTLLVLQNTTQSVNINNVSKANSEFPCVIMNHEHRGEQRFFSVELRYWGVFFRLVSLLRCFPIIIIGILFLKTVWSIIHQNVPSVAGGTAWWEPGAPVDQVERSKEDFYTGREIGAHHGFPEKNTPASSGSEMLSSLAFSKQSE
jgi:hypothetical protein